MRADEMHLRRDMDRLKEYTIMRNMDYSKLLHLAYHVKQTTYKYKQYVYKEGDTANSLYLVQQG